MKKRLYEALEKASEFRIYIAIAWLIYCRVNRASIRFLKQCFEWLYYRELYLFPPLAFVADYSWMKQVFPNHPISELGIVSSAFMTMTLTLFILRPPKRVKAHWVKTE
jgi:hypothetical protein